MTRPAPIPPPAPRRSLRDGVWPGVLVLGVYALAYLVNWVLLVMFRMADYPAGSWVIGLLCLVVGDLAVAALIAGFARHRRGAVAALLAVALLLQAAGWLASVATIQRIDALSWFAHDFWRGGAGNVAQGAAVALAVAAWILGRRTSLVPLVLAPFAGLIVGLAWWLVPMLLVDAWRPDGSSQWEWHALMFVNNALWVVAVVVPVVACAWLAAALDRPTGSA